MTIAATPREPAKRVYPHVSEIKEWPSQQTIRLLWDRIFDLQEGLTAAQATITQLLAGHNANETAITTAQRSADQALAIAQRPGAGGTTDAGGSGEDDLPGGGDGGQGQVGCSAAGATGHDSGGLLDPVRAGQIVCGTGNEYSALKNAVANQSLRDANAEELILRMIWHLKEAGFTAGRQQNPSGAISSDKLCVVVDGVTRAYDVLTNKNDPSTPMTTVMSEVAPPVLVDDAGIPD